MGDQFLTPRTRTVPAGRGELPTYERHFYQEMTLLASEKRAWIHRKQRDADAREEANSGIFKDIHSCRSIDPLSRHLVSTERRRHWQSLREDGMTDVEIVRELRKGEEERSRKRRSQQNVGGFLFNF